MKRTTITHCAICGAPFEITVGGRGRPAQYCGEACKAAASLIGRLSGVLERIDFVDEDARRSLRGLLMTDVVNALRPTIDVDARRAAGAELRASRKAAGLTQAELSRATGIPRGRISHFETGDRAPSADELGALELVLADGRPADAEAELEAAVA